MNLASNHIKNNNTNIQFNNHHKQSNPKQESEREEKKEGILELNAEFRIEQS